MELPTKERPVLVATADAMKELPGLPDDTFDMTCTDPPYSSGGMMRGDRVQATKIKYVDTGTREELPEFAGDNRDQRAFGYWSTLWLGECYRATKPGGVVAVFADWRQLATMIDVIQAAGYIFRGIVPWDKTESARPARGRYRNQCEYVVWGTKGPRPYSGECLPGVVRVGVKPGQKEHIAQKPVDVLRQLIRIVPPRGLILDPFGGLATIGIAAVREKRRALILEIDPAAAKRGRERVYRAMQD